MNSQRVFIQQLTGYTTILIVGLAGIVAAHPAIAQSPISQDSRILVQAPALQGSWRLTNMTEPPFPTPMVPVGELTAEFAKGRVAGSGGCNRFNGGYKTTGNQLKIGPLASTFKACQQPVMDQETKYLKALQAATRFEVTDQGLQIFYQTDQGEGVLRFVSQTVRGLW